MKASGGDRSSPVKNDNARLRSVSYVGRGAGGRRKVATLYFPHRGSKLDARGKRELLKAVKYGARNGVTALELFGYADVRGTEAENVRLASKRIRSVEAAIASSGVREIRQWRNTRRPVGETGTKGKRAKARRVDVYMTAPFPRRKAAAEAPTERGKPEKTPQRKFEARLAKVVGDVELRIRTGRWVKASAGVLLPKGSRVRTRSGGRAVIEWLGGAGGKQTLRENSLWVLHGKSAKLEARRNRRPKTKIVPGKDNDEGMRKLDERVRR